jgi:hypothetical protein
MAYLRKYFEQRKVLHVHGMKQVEQGWTMYRQVYTLYTNVQNKYIPCTPMYRYIYTKWNSYSFTYLFRFCLYNVYTRCMHWMYKFMCRCTYNTNAKNCKGLGLNPSFGSVHTIKLPQQLGQQLHCDRYHSYSIQLLYLEVGDIHPELYQPPPCWWHNSYNRSLESWGWWQSRPLRLMWLHTPVCSQEDDVEAHSCPI